MKSTVTYEDEYKVLFNEWLDVLCYLLLEIHRFKMRSEFFLWHWIKFIANALLSYLDIYELLLNLKINVYEFFS